MQQYESYYESIGFGEEVRTLQDAASRDDNESMMAACTDGIVDTIALAGPPDELHGQFQIIGEIADSFTLCIPFYGAYFKIRVSITLRKSQKPFTRNMLGDGICPSHLAGHWSKQIIYKI